jgi:hypothetical protein
MLSLFFPEYKMMLTPRSLIFKGKNGIITIDETNFEIL